MSQRIAFIVVLLGAVLWGTTGTAQTFMPQTVHPLAVGASRLAVGGFTLLAIMLILRKIDFRNWPWKATILSALAMAVFQYCFFTSIRLTGIAIGTVVAIGSAPMFSGIIEWLILKKHPTKIWLTATSLAIVGCVLLFSNKEGLIVNPIGVSLSLCAGLLFAFYTLFNKEVLEKADAIPSVAVIFSVSAIMLMPFLFIFETEGLLTVPGISTMIYLGIAHDKCGVYPIFRRIAAYPIIICGNAVASRTAHCRDFKCASSRGEVGFHFMERYRASIRRNPRFNVQRAKRKGCRKLGSLKNA